MPERVPIPPSFLERMQHLLGDEFAAFADALDAQPVNGLRVNTLKLDVHQFQAITPFLLGDAVPWCDSAFTLPTSDFSFGKHPYHLAGLYYLQDPSAMAPAELLEPQPGECVLDLAAAPGGKTTALAALMQGKGLLVANEIKDKRVGHLAVNVERWGAGNVVITNETPERLADHFGPFFNRVLVDAPCSGEGMFRKDMGARRDWSVEMVAGCAIRQRNILRVAAKLVRPGGVLLYSTCTFAPEENEQVISNLLDEFPEYTVDRLPDFPGFQRGKPEWMGLTTKDTKDTTDTKGKGLDRAVRLFPHHVSGEGHFACRLRRAEDRSGRGNETLAQQRSHETLARHRPDRLADPSREQERLWHVFAGEVLRVELGADRLRVRGERLYYVPEGLLDLGYLRVPVPGVWLGTFKKERFEPAHPLALFLRPSQTRNVLDLPADSREMAAYLRGESLSAEGAPGWMLVTVDGWPLGWGKRVQGILKNHYPKGWQVVS
jgi:NOL1/NOP2/sun family putative RNA methylase